MQLSLAVHYTQLKKKKKEWKKKNSCEKWCPKFKGTSIRIHFSAWWIIEQQPEQPWVLALFCDGFCMNKTLFGLQNCLRCRDTALCSNMKIALDIVLFGYSFWFSVLCPCISNSACVSLSVLNFDLPAWLSLFAISLSLPPYYILSFSASSERTWMEELPPREPVKKKTH